MHSPAISALTVMLFGLSGLLLWAAASAWAKLAGGSEPPDQRPVIPVHAFRRAAGLTSAAFVMLGFAVVWLALTFLR